MSLFAYLLIVLTINVAILITTDRGYAHYYHTMVITRNQLSNQCSCAKKRRRETSEQNPMDTLSNEQSLTISSLPDNLLGKIACYVEKPSRPLFAVALNSKCNWNNEKWNSLDFSDISKELAAKLSDDDLAGVLNCIEAQDNLETLKLTGCVT